MVRDARGFPISEKLEELDPAAEASGNRQLAEMLGHVHDRLARFMVVSHAGQSMLEYRHEPLIEALRTRDPATARQAMLDELDEMREVTLEHVTREESAFWYLGTHSQQTERGEK
jgi:DNA-binding GntR family transcriptional regulator